MAANFRRCYNDGLRDDPEMAGSVRVTVRIGARGVVEHAEAGSLVGLSPKVVDCLRGVVLAAQFLPPEGGGATIFIPVTLKSIPAAARAADGGAAP